MNIRKHIRLSYFLLVGTMLVSSIAISKTASASPLYGSYEGLLFVGSGRIEGVMMNIDLGGNMVFVSEEGDNSDTDPTTGLVPNDFETTAWGAWRRIGKQTLEFGTMGFRAGSGLCTDISDDDPPKLPSCTFIFTGRLTKDVRVREMECDLGGNGRLARRSIDGSIVQDIGIDIDYCLRKVTAETYLNLVPVP